MEPLTLKLSVCCLAGVSLNNAGLPLAVMLTWANCLLHPALYIADKNEKTWSHTLFPKHWTNPLKSFKCLLQNCVRRETGDRIDCVHEGGHDMQQSSKAQSRVLLFNGMLPELLLGGKTTLKQMLISFCSVCSHVCGIFRVDKSFFYLEAWDSSPLKHTITPTHKQHI